MGTDADLVRGTMNTLLLETISRGPMYGYQLCKALNAKTDGYFELREGSLYPALHRLEREGLLSSFWKQTDAGRRRKYYKITNAGQEALAKKREEWSRFSAAVDHVLGRLTPAGDASPQVSIA